MTVFFTGCTHFDHANIIRLANRPFASVEEMNETMIERWNAKVGPRDDVYHLGDFGWIKQRTRAPQILGALNGVKRLVWGNHDGDTITRSGRWLTSSSYSEVGYLNLVLFHYPIEEWNGFWRGWRHLHCHTHSHDKKGKVPIERRVNVSVEAWDYAPAALEEIQVVWP